MGGNTLDVLLEMRLYLEENIIFLEVAQGSGVDGARSKGSIGFS